MLAIALFVIQFQQSIKKYLEFPVVVQTSTVPVKDLPTPTVYICQTEQFNFTEARTLGYDTLQRFVGGVLKRDNSTYLFSWKGKEGNLTYEELENMLFVNDYTNMKVFPENGIGNPFSLERSLMFPHGICMRVLYNKSKSLFVHAKHRVQILVVDPSQANDVWTEEDPDAKTIIGPSSENQYEKGIYEIDYTVYDATIHDGTTCTDYTKSEITYGKCVSNLMKEKLMNIYGCLPPWVPAHESECIYKTEMNIYSGEIFEDPVFKALKELLDNREVDMFQNCLPPCVSMKIKLQRTRFDTKFPDHVVFKAFSKGLAKKLTDVFSYDEFNFIVDFGSALGLWMGLSCLSILDQILETWASFMKFWKK